MGALSEDGWEVTVLAGLDALWADAAAHLAAGPGGETVAAAEVEFVPPVLPGARVVCIGLNYLKHVAEGSFKDHDVPPYPTLFARWTTSLTVGDTLSLIARTFTLRPGDLLATGTPSGVGYARTPPWLLQPGDVVEVEVDKLGVLRNTVVSNETRRG